MLEVKELVVRINKGGNIINQLNFGLKQGICTGLTGASGSGKTTLMKALMGVSDSATRVSSGEILLNGKNLLDLDKRERRKLCGTTLGFIPQNPMTAFNQHVPVGSQMTETFRKRLNMKKKEARDLSMELLKQVHLTDTKRVYQAYPGQLSGGMLQRVTMAMLIGMKPQYVLADEPTSALDEANKEYLICELAKLKAEAAILFVSHDEKAIQALCDELLVLQNGKIVEQGKTAAVFSRPEHTWTKHFVSLAAAEEGGDWTWEKLK